MGNIVNENNLKERPLRVAARRPSSKQSKENKDHYTTHTLEGNYKIPTSSN